jgi:hypothetical protein
MIGPQNVHHTKTNRETGAPERGFGSVVPRHHPDHGKMRLDTTNKVDFKSPWPGWSPSKVVLVLVRCISQYNTLLYYRDGSLNTLQYCITEMHLPTH